MDCGWDWIVWRVRTKGVVLGEICVFACVCVLAIYRLMIIDNAIL